MTSKDKNNIQYKNFVIKHYKNEKVADVIKAWAVDGNAWRCGNKDFSGWYKTLAREREGEKLIEVKQPFHPVRDYEELAKCRTIYTTITLSTADPFRTGKVAKWKENGKERRKWLDSCPLPDYPDIVAISLLCDADLWDEVKEEVKRKGRSKKLKTIVVKAINFVYSKFKQLCPYGNAVKLLDSGGGFYCLIDHRVTAPIGREFDGEERAAIFEELCNRFNRWLRGVWEELKEKIPEAAEILKIDALNHKNRLMKAPLSVHKSLPWVVHPIDPENLDFDEVELPVNDELIRQTLEWVKLHPSDEDALANLNQLIAVLFSEYEGNWKERLQKWIADRKKKEEEKRKLLEEVRNQRRVETNAVTDNFDDILEAIRNVSMFELVAPYVTEDRGDGHPRFDPPYRPSQSGTSCFVCNERKFHDLAWGQSGDVIQFVALELGIISSLNDYPKGKDWWKCVDELRRRGFKIPLHAKLCQN